MFSTNRLLEKYDITTSEGLQKALADLESQEAQVDEKLSKIVSNASLHNLRLNEVSQSYNKMLDCRKECEKAAFLLENTASMARQVSAKVRQLDSARARVAATQKRVNDVLYLQYCRAGVEAAIKAHDYETGASHVSRFLKIDPGTVEVAGSASGGLRDAMAEAACLLQQQLLTKFEEASKKEDNEAVERLFKLFPQIGCADEGMDLFAKYILKQLESAARQACRVSSAQPACFADAFTRLLETAARAVERAREGASEHAPATLIRAVRILQPCVCANAARVCVEMVGRRGLGTAPAGGPLAVEPCLAELAVALNVIHLYFGFLRNKVQANVSSLDDKEKASAMTEIDKIIAECQLTVISQDLLGHYLTLERYFLDESINKALKMSMPQPGDTSSTLVDDVFFIARKVISRSVSTGSVDGVCAAVNEAGAALERAASALRLRLRTPPPRTPPQLFPASRDGSFVEDDTQWALYLAQANEADLGAEWSEQLAEEAVAAGGTLSRGGTAPAKLRHCAGGLAVAAAAFRAAADHAAAAILAAMHAQIVQWAEMIADPEDNEDVGAVAGALEEFAARAAGTEGNEGALRTGESLVAALVAEVVTRAEEQMLKHRYTMESGMVVEARARRVAAWAGGGAGGAAREACARLTQAAALLALDTPDAAADALTPAPRLSSKEALALLARRSDFKMKDIKRLKL